MADIDELERRVRAALDRIGAGLEAIPAAGAGADPQEIAALQEALDEEKLANAQFEDRVRTLNDRLAAAEADKAAAVEAQKSAMSDLDAELQKLRRANDMLRESNAALRAANAEGVGEPHLINKAMLAELESIKAARAADAAEGRAILAALDPLLAATETGEAH